MQEMQEMQVQSLGQEDPLEQEMATHSSILAWEIQGQRSLVGYSPPDGRVGHDWPTEHALLEERIPFQVEVWKNF